MQSNGTKGAVKLQHSRHLQRGRESGRRNQAVRPGLQTQTASIAKTPEAGCRKLAAIVERERVREEKAQPSEKSSVRHTRRSTRPKWKRGERPDACKHVGDGEPSIRSRERWNAPRQREHEEWEATKVEKIAAWKRGENVRLRVTYSEPALLRVRTFDADDDVAVSSVA